MRIRTALMMLPLLCLITSLVVAGERQVPPFPRANPAEVGMDPAALKKIDESLQKFVDAKKVAGGVVLVARNGKIVLLSAIGKADIAGARPMKPDTVFALASTTKSLSAAALMVLVDEGKVDLDAPLAKYLPSFKDMRLKGGVKPAREIIIRDCLRHTSGLPNKSKEGKTLAEIVEAFSKMELLFEPGSAIEYGPGLHVAARVVEVVSGKSFEQFSSERIFQPLGMVDTTYRPNAEQQRRCARIYKPSEDGKDLVPAEHDLMNFATVATRVPNPSGGMFSTAPDMARFYQMILNGGEFQGKRILSAESVKQMGTLQTSGLTVGTLPGRGWGLGFRFVFDPNGGENLKKLTRGTFGHGGAFGTEGWIDPTHRTVFVLLIQRQKFPATEADKIRETLQGEMNDAIRN